MTTLVTAIRAAIRAARAEGLDVDRISVNANTEEVVLETSAGKRGHDGARETGYALGERDVY